MVLFQFFEAFIHASKQLRFASTQDRDTRAAFGPS
jgi:hypothetical protein